MTLQSSRRGNSKRRNVIGDFDISNEMASSKDAERKSRGRGLSSVWQLEEILVRENFGEPARSEKHTFSRVTVAKPATTKKSRELERTSREPDFGSQRIRFFHGNENKVISTLLSSKHQPPETVECSAEAGDETGEAKGTRRRERILLDLQKPVIPAEAIEGVVKRIDLLGSVSSRKI